MKYSKIEIANIFSCIKTTEKEWKRILRTANWEDWVVRDDIYRKIKCFVTVKIEWKKGEERELYFFEEWEINFLKDEKTLLKKYFKDSIKLMSLEDFNVVFDLIKKIENE